MPRLQPAATAGANSTYTLQVDNVEVNRTNTTTSANLLSNGGFEDDVAHRHQFGAGHDDRPVAALRQQLDRAG